MSRYSAFSELLLLLVVVLLLLLLVLLDRLFVFLQEDCPVADDVSCSVAVFTEKSMSLVGWIGGWAWSSRPPRSGILNRFVVSANMAVAYSPTIWLPVWSRTKFNNSDWVNVKESVYVRG